MPSVFLELYPGIEHLLCRWHVDRYACIILVYRLKYIVIIDHNYRAWQRKLYALVQDGNNREELYKCLHMLLTTSEENTFSDLLSKFVVCWRSKEPSFVEYFETSYAGQPGTYMNTCIDDLSMIILLLKKNGLCAIDILITVWIQTCLLRGKIKHFIIL